MHIFEIESTHILFVYLFILLLAIAPKGAKERRREEREGMLQWIVCEVNIFGLRSDCGGYVVVDCV